MVQAGLSLRMLVAATVAMGCVVAVSPPALAQATKAESKAKVMLGDNSLTAGIPGKGPLTVAEITAWLAKPENHLPLEVELPMGLATGSIQITGLKENPLTRAKIELGRQLYFDTRLSSDNTVSCASGHHPDEGYGKQTQFGIGVNGQQGGRNSPVSYSRILRIGAETTVGLAALSPLSPASGGERLCLESSESGDVFV